ncbi:CDP-glycerol glycerophosphotransferase family protein [Microbacterium sp. NPDC055683]
MASFSFGAGNAAKIARIPLYALGRLGTLVIPRGSTWAFGCGAGVGDGPLAVQRIAASDGRRTVWVAATADEARDARAAGLRVVRRSSWRGYWETARAGVLVVGFGTGDVNPYAVSGGLLVQLWHGIPLKRIGLDSAETLRTGALPDVPLVRGAIRLLYRAAQRRIALLPAASHLVRGRLESAFGLPDDRIVVTGEPRVDVLSAGDPGDRRREARVLLARVAGGFRSTTRLVLYAPTWRDGAPDPAVPSTGEWRAIVDMLDRRDALLLVRSHRLGAGSYAPPFPTDRVRDLGADRLRDVTAALPGVDALVTDYSSLLYDAGLVPLPVIALAPDLEEYRARRGFYGRYEDAAGDDAARTWADALARLDAVLGDPALLAEGAERSARLSARVHAFRDGGNARRVYAAIQARAARRRGRP